MGIAIHYQGTIDDYANINALVDDVEAICLGLEWPYEVLTKETIAIEENKSADTSDNYKIENLRGISVTPPESGTLFLTFLPNSSLCSPVKLTFEYPPATDLMIKVIHTKTQFAGYQVHIAILKLLKYLKREYISDLIVADHGMYWETEDEAILQSQFEKYNSALEIFPPDSPSPKPTEGQNIQSLKDKIEELLLKKGK